MEVTRLQLNMDNGSPPVISAVGELDFGNCGQLDSRIREVMGEEAGDIDLSLGGLDFVDSSGLRILVTRAQDARKSGHWLRIISLTPQLAHLLDVSGFGHLFRVMAEPDELESPAHNDRPAQPRLLLEIPRGTNACRDARNTACSFAADMGFKDAELDDIRLAVGEAVSNAFRHGMPNGGSVHMRCLCEDGTLCLELKYPSAHFDPDQVPIPSLDPPPEGGMGIYFMRLVMDQVRYSYEDGHMVVKLERKRRNGLGEGDD